MSTVALVREVIVNGKRERQTLNLGRGRRPNNLAEGSFYRMRQRKYRIDGLEL